MAESLVSFEREEATVYICNPNKLPGFFETPHLTSEASGMFSHINDYYLQMSRPLNLSVKWIAYPGLGSRVNGSEAYTGCIGLIQKGMADGMIYLVEYPLNIVNLSQGHVFYDDRYGYMGSFPFAKFEPFNVAKIFSSFDTETWLAILFLLLIFRLLIYINFKFLLKYYPLEFQSVHRNHYSFRILAHFIEKGRIEDTTATLKATWILLTLFSFFSITIFGGLIKTGSVMSKPPLLFLNYQDLMKHNVKPTVFVDDRRVMAKPGTPEFKLWTWATSRFSERELVIVNHEMDQFVKLAFETVSYQRVLFGISFLMKILLSTMCDFMARGGEQGYEPVFRFAQSSSSNPEVRKLKLKDKKFQGYIEYPQSLKPHMTQMIYSKNSPYAHFTRPVMAKLLEYGFVLRERNSLDETNVASILMDLDSVFDGKKVDRQLKQACMQSIPVDEERDADQLSMIPLVALKTCFEVFFACTIISSIYFLHERFLLAAYTRPVQKLATTRRPYRTPFPHY